LIAPGTAPMESISSFYDFFYLPVFQITTDCFQHPMTPPVWNFVLFHCHYYRNSHMSCASLTIVIPYWSQIVLLLTTLAPKPFCLNYSSWLPAPYMTRYFLLSPTFPALDVGVSKASWVLLEEMIFRDHKAGSGGTHCCWAGLIFRAIWWIELGNVCSFVDVLIKCIMSIRLNSWQ
jgi:hypothetical protein